jgi:hypothetical protein
MKSDLWTGGRSSEGRMSLGMVVGKEVRESGERDSTAATRRVGICDGSSEYASKCKRILPSLKTVIKSKVLLKYY